MYLQISIRHPPFMRYFTQYGQTGLLVKSDTIHWLPEAEKPASIHIPPKRTSFGPYGFDHKKRRDLEFNARSPSIYPWMAESKFQPPPT